MTFQCFSISFLLAASSVADTVWNPSENTPPVAPPATGAWHDAGNWTLGIPSGLPPGETKGVFNIANGATCEISDLRTIDQLVMDVDGTGSVLEIIDGGTLNTGNVWSSIGYRKAGSRLTIRSGAMATFANHLWIGFNEGAVGHLDILGGSVAVSGQFGLGWEGGSGHVTIDQGGLLELDQIEGSRSISATSSLDISDGAVVIDGDRSTSIFDYISAGRITAYGGSGTPIYDYDVTHPGKTTVRAIPNPLPTQWRIASTQYPTTDWIITPFDAANDFGIVADGVTDVTQPIQDALIMLGNLGGGALFLPEGHYRLDGNLVIPQGVMLRGDWQKPNPGDPVTGTVLMAHAGRGDENAPPFIKLNNSAGVNGVSIWYPEQLPTDPQPYPPTLGNGGGATIENITLVNPWFGFTTFVEGTTARPFVRNVYGTPLKTGLEFDCLADIGRIETVHFSPEFWAGSGLTGSPTLGEHEAWLHAEATGIIVRRIDWSYSCYVTVEGYHIGLALRPGRHDGKTPNGQSYGFNLINCRTGVLVEASAYAGYQFTRFSISDANIGIHIGPDADQTNLFHTCSIDAEQAAMLNEGDARITMMSSDIQRGPLRLNGGYLSLIHSDFAASSPSHVELGAGVQGATLLGNRFGGSPRIINRSAFPVHVDHTPLNIKPLPDYDYRKPSSAHRPTQAELLVVTDAPFSATADGTSDDTPAFQAALTAASNLGGGTVLVPGGTYRLNGNLVIPTGVELRGIFDLPNDTKVKGSLIHVHAGHNDAQGTPFIQLESGAGIRGLSFHYPDQIFDESDTVNYGMVPYPYLLRGLGDDIHVLNLSATIPYQLLDLATHRCDRHYVDYIFSTALLTGIHVGKGAVDGEIHNCQFNPSAYTHAGRYYDSIPFDTSDAIHEILWRDATPYLFGDMTGEILHQNFVFGGAKGFHMVAEDSGGPSGHCLGMGVDQCTVAMLIEHVGDADLAPINSQIVTVDRTAGRYLETSPSLNRPFSMFSLAGWGSHQFSSVIQGGDIELQLLHLAPAGQEGSFVVENEASLINYGGNLRDHLPDGRPFLTIDPTATAEFTGNIINTVASQMPSTTTNVTGTANLRVGESEGSILTSDWTNTQGDRAWDDDRNWTAPYPDSDVHATIGDTSPSGPSIPAGTEAHAKHIIAGGAIVATDPVHVDGGSMTTSEWIILGDQVGETGMLAIDEGQLTCGSHLIIGYDGHGVFNMGGGQADLGGSLIIAAHPGATGSATFENGSLSAKALAIGDGGILDLIDGEVILEGDHLALLNEYIANGQITSQGGSSEPSVDYDVSHAGMTTLSGTPPDPTSTVWNSTTTSAWTDDSNWTGEEAPINQGQHLKVTFNVEGAAACILSTPSTVAQLVLGDNGTTNGNSLALASGAHLTAGLDIYGEARWTGIGYNRDATLTVGTGATLVAKNHLWIGLNAPSNGHLDIAGGTVTVDGQLGLGWGDGTGSIQISEGGSLVLAELHPTRSINGASRIDIEEGSIVLAGDRTADMTSYVDAGKITGFGESSLVVINFDPDSDLTTVTATPPPTGFEVWSMSWAADIGPEEHDHDGDTRSNLYEYAFSGDPTDIALPGIAPSISATGQLALTHLIRKDDPALIYQVETSNTLQEESWQGISLPQIESQPYDDNYDQIFLEVPSNSDSRFFRIRVSYP